MVSKPERKIGYLLGEKKCHKLNPSVFSVLCRENGFKLYKIDMERPLEEQGPFAVIINKLTDIITQADSGCQKSQQVINDFESYIRLHPEVVVLDPLSKVRVLLDRSLYYSILLNSSHQEDVFFPNFVELTSTNVTDNTEVLKAAGVSFPFVCKPTLAHGKTGAHDMLVVFNEKGLKDCQPPCVAQSFINHNAKLYKIFIIGKRFHVTERPSLKNFYPNDQPSIFFNSHDVSKPKSKSHLNVMSPEEVAEAEAESLTYKEAAVGEIVETLRRTIGTDLMGVDIVIEKGTGRHAIIDINVFPGYEGFPNSLESLMECIIEKTASNCLPKETSSDINQDDSGCDAGYSSDEKYKLASISSCKKTLPRFLPRPEEVQHHTTLI